MTTTIRIIILISASLFCSDFYAQKETFKVMAWNILHGGNDIENGQQNVVKIIREINPDIITKTSLIVGLRETDPEIYQTL